ncbi:MAG TPA: PIN domain-containing protein [Spirochaetota bacterium]|nr:PIN domain-containing protein [Spirochaetota bacterium]HPQ54017.1 PIN domain-containing protein [Spirochaetota bacterium]
MDNYVLDACALIAFFYDEEGADSVESLLNRSEEGSIGLYLHKINLLEIYYNFRREYDRKTLTTIMEQIGNLPIIVVDGLSDEVFVEAGRLKSEYRVSLADSIALAEAHARNAFLVTADHHELDIIDDREEFLFHWIR